MMAKFIRFNKMTRFGMKNAGSHEMVIYDYLVNFFVQTAKAKRSITREQLQGSLEKKMRKITNITKAKRSITREQLQGSLEKEMRKITNITKANPSITREQLQGSLENEMRKITRTNNTRTNNTRTNNRYPFLPATMRTGGVPIGVAA